MKRTKRNSLSGQAVKLGPWRYRPLAACLALFGSASYALAQVSSSSQVILPLPEPFCITAQCQKSIGEELGSPTSVTLELRTWFYPEATILAIKPSLAGLTDTRQVEVHVGWHDKYAPDGSHRVQSWSGAPGVPGFRKALEDYNPIWGLTAYEAFRKKQPALQPKSQNTVRFITDIQESGELTATSFLNVEIADDRITSVSRGVDELHHDGPSKSYYPISTYQVTCFHKEEPYKLIPKTVETRGFFSIDPNRQVKLTSPRFINVTKIESIAPDQTLEMTLGEVTKGLTLDTREK